MNIGDKIYCKKDFYGYENLRNKPFFCAGESYIIRYIRNNEVTIFFKNMISGWTTFIINENNTTIFDKDYANLYDYFYTEKEVRKLKLKQIDEGRR